MKVLVTGADGFIAKNLIVRFGEVDGFEAVPFTRQTPESRLPAFVSDIDAVVHLAGINRPLIPNEFAEGNTGLTERLCQTLIDSNRKVPVIFSSSTQVALDNPYGMSKRDAENALRKYSALTGAPVYIYRLPNIFGKWCKPNYNSAVATFCYNIARGLPIKINDPNIELTLAYVDDLVNEFIDLLKDVKSVSMMEICSVPVEYKITVGALAKQIELFRDSRASMISERVGLGLTRALYATYVSYLQPDSFSYELPKHGDTRGVFVEMLKTKDSGQFSFFTAHPGVTRGGHYHHSKTEKFLVIKGETRFRFRNILTDERHEIFASGQSPKVVETVPGWTHDITNVGSDEVVVMLWTNEIFDRSRPDTIPCKV